MGESILSSFDDDIGDEDTDEWADATTIQAASVKDVAYLKRDLDEVRRGLRTVWVLCIVALTCLVISLAFLAARPVGLSQDDLREVLQDDRMDKVLDRLDSK